MKSLLLAALLACSVPALAQSSYTGPEVAAPVKWASTIVLHSADSASTAYTKALRALLAAGYGIERSDKDGLYITTSTPGKALEGNVFLTIRVAVSPAASGSEVAFRGVYTWASAAMVMAERQNKPLTVQFIGRGGNPTQRAWDGMQQVALLAVPGARLGYK
jgi:hypothetical protein